MRACEHARARCERPDGHGRRLHRGRRPGDAQEEPSKFHRAAWTMAIGLTAALVVMPPGNAAGPDLTGTWTMGTTPPISLQMPRGKQECVVMPIEIVFTSGLTPLSGTLAMWRGDTTRSGPLSGTFDGEALKLTGAGFEFQGTYDRATGVVTGTVLELPGRLAPDGEATSFRMTRSSTTL